MTDAARPYLDHQPDGGSALNRLESRIARLVGAHIGGAFAETTPSTTTSAANSPGPPTRAPNPPSR